MTNITTSQQSLIDEGEKGYRRGYHHAASHILDTVKGKLTPADAQKLNDWFNQQLTPWRNTTNPKPTQTPPNTPVI